VTKNEEDIRACVFALTGGIGSGKSSVAKIFREEGIPVIDADLVAREAVAPGTVGLKKVASTFGQQVLDDKGTLDRGRLGRLVFEKPKARRALEEIVHPIVRDLVTQRIAAFEAQGHPLICYEIPLLYETNQEAKYRPVVVVVTDAKTQLERIVARDQLGEREAQARIDAQLPLEQKRKLADICIVNDSNPEELTRRARAALKEVKAAC
jgi:dephospho-CoA kinase